MLWALLSPYNNTIPGKMENDKNAVSDWCPKNENENVIVAQFNL